MALLREPWERSQPQRRPPWDPAFDAPFEPLRYGLPIRHELASTRLT